MTSKLTDKRDPISHRNHDQMLKQSRGYNSRPDQIKKRDERDKARRRLEKEGRVSKGDGMEADHKKSLKNGGSNKPENIRLVTRRVNREKGAKNV